MVVMLAPGGNSPAGAHEAEIAVLERLQTREAFLADKATTAARESRQQALTAYRLSRRRQLDFVGNAPKRRDDAQAASLALAIVGRSLLESNLFADELHRIRLQRETLQAHVAAGASATATAEDTALAQDTALQFQMPVRGAVVGTPRLHRDAMTAIEVRRDGLQILSRMNEPVHATEAGVVHIVAELPQGGRAVVVKHSGGWSSIVSGLRDVTVSAGQTVQGGQILGFVGRTLDGASVLTFELWRRRTSVDPRPEILRGKAPARKAPARQAPAHQAPVMLRRAP